MKHTLSFMIIAALFALANVAQAQTRPAAKSSSYETLSDGDRRIVSAIYESQLGSRRDLAGHPLLSKDKIAAAHGTMSMAVWCGMAAWHTHHCAKP